MSYSPVYLGKYFLFHVDFEAKNADVPCAPKEMFFAELTMPCAPIPDQLPSVSLCVSIGPTKAISGDILNGCYHCRKYNNVHHPKAGGFVRGGDGSYKTVEDICGIELNNVENHLPMLKQVSQANEPKKDCEYTSEQVEDARPYANEAMMFFNQLTVSFLLNVNFLLFFKSVAFLLDSLDLSFCSVYLGLNFIA